MLDYYRITDTFTKEEKQVQTAVRDFVKSEVQPHISEWWELGEFPKDLPGKLGSLGLLGSTLPKSYGASGVSNISYGLIMYELERSDSGLRSFASVQGALVMYPIFAFGSEKHRREYIPKLAKGELTGCFGLSEHDGASDPGSLNTRASKDKDSYTLNGTKMWITNGGTADIAIIWARDDDDTIRGFIVPTDTQGFTTNLIKRKVSLRISETSELVLQNVRVPEENMLPEASGLSAPLSCLTAGRYGIAWGALGALEAVYTESLEFSKTRSTFGEGLLMYRHLLWKKHTLTILLNIRPT